MSGAMGLGGEESAQEGKYRVLAELGQGGTAVVYLAVAHGPSGFNKLVVLKCLKKSLATDPEFRNMFLNEARLAARLNHPNIVQTNEVVEDDGVPVIVMEYLEGQPFSNLLIRARQGRITLATQLRIIVDALAGLHYAHELRDFDGTSLGVVHRDVTPHNVFVTFEGQVKILDFGIAKLGTSMIETQVGVIKGKIRYMPPEQISGEAVDRRADIYAVGVMLWEAATGERLWKDDSDATIMNRVLNGEIPSPRQKRPEIPEEVERICMKALAADPDQRYATAADLEQDLESFLDTLGIEGRVNNRQLAKLAGETFSDVRLKTKALIEAQLSKIASLSWTEYNAAQAMGQAPTMTFASATLDQSSSSVERNRLQHGRRRARLTWLAGPLGILLLFAVWRLTAREQGKAPEAVAPPPAAVTSPEVASQPVAPASVSLRISASPPQSKLFFDSEQLPSNPFTGTRTRDGNEHTIRAEASGYTSSTTSVVLDRDAEIMLALQSSTPAANAAGKNRSRAAATPTAPAGPSPAKPDCNPPYFIDGRGIKRFKPECM